MNQASYWTGVLSLPALILAVAAGWVLAKVAGHLAERLFVGGTHRVTPESTKHKRVGIAAVMYGARRAWMIGRGDVGLVLIVGIDNTEVAVASKRLDPPLTLRQFQRGESPASESEPEPGDDDL